MRIRDKFDRLALASVCNNNEYGLKEFTGHEVVVDVGAHIGAFSLAAWVRGAQWIYAFEPEKENHHLLEENLNGTGALIRQAAVISGLAGNFAPFKRGFLNFGASRLFDATWSQSSKLRGVNTDEV